jgi:hypothetical protein
MRPMMLIVTVFSLLSVSLMAAEFRSCGCCGGSAGTCRPVVTTEPIKKVVYESRMVPYCRHCLPGFFEGPGCTRSCQCRPSYKRVLVKKEIVCGERQVVKCEPVTCVEGD